MWTVRSSIIPVKGYKAMALWPLVFIRKEAEMGAADMRHEEIHGSQQKEMLVVPFLLWYAVEWLVRLVIYRNAHKAYRMISFEQEAYIHEQDALYLETRRHFAWTRHIFNI